MKKIIFDFLMGVGKKYYPTPKHFIDEAKRLGISKRIPFIPKGFVFEKSKIFLVHWGTREIFGFFIPTRIEFIGVSNKKILEEAVKAGAEVRIVSMGEAASEPERGCGTRIVGGAYLACEFQSPEDIQKVLEKLREEGLLSKESFAKLELAGSLILLKKPIKYNGSFFRGIRYIKVDIANGTYKLLKVKFRERSRKRS